MSTFKFKTAAVSSINNKSDPKYRYRKVLIKAIEEQRKYLLDPTTPTKLCWFSQNADGYESYIKYCKQNLVVIQPDQRVILASSPTEMSDAYLEVIVMVHSGDFDDQIIALANATAKAVQNQPVAVVPASVQRQLQVQQRLLTYQP